MGLWFDENNKQDEILLKYLPKGRIFKQAHIDGTDFNKIIKWLGSGFAWLIEIYNETFKGIFICKSDFLLENYKKDYSIPNEIFYETTSDEHRKDIFVLKHLMKGNTEWHFKAIANIYGYDVDIIAGVPYLEGKRFVYSFPVKIGVSVLNPKNILVIVFKRREAGAFVYSFPLAFRGDLQIAKIKKIYDIIRQSQINIIYKEDDVISSERVDLCLT